MGRGGGPRAAQAALRGRYAARLGGFRLHPLGPRPLRIPARRRRRARVGRRPATAVAGGRGGGDREPAYAARAFELLAPKPRVPPGPRGRGRYAAATRRPGVRLARSPAARPHAPERRARELARGRAANPPAPRRGHRRRLAWSL